MGGARSAAGVFLLCVAALVAGCGGDGDHVPDGSMDLGVPDAPSDLGSDGSIDAPPDGSIDASADVADLGADAPACSEPMPFRCADGTCVASALGCFFQGGCAEPTPFRCPDARCVATLAECFAGGGCTEPTPVKCIDGRCTGTLLECFESDCEEPTPIPCPNDATRCVADQSELLQCFVSEDCPSATPFECVDGRCVLSPFDCACAEPTPVACLNDLARCEANQLACLTSEECPDEMPFICPDARCVDLPIDCDCMEPTPFRCVLSTRCVADRLECLAAPPDAGVSDAGP